MPGETMPEQVRRGMPVFASNGKRLGTVRQVYVSETETYVQVVRLIDKLKMWQPELKSLFLPSGVVAAVTSKRVHLNIDSTIAKGYWHRPKWIPPDITVLPTPDGGSN